MMTENRIHFYFLGEFLALPFLWFVNAIWFRIHFYFLGGFLALPFLWFVNAIWFFKYAFLKPHFEEQAAIRQYVIRSAIGSFVWIAALVAWVIVYQLNRASWGATADYFTFVIPQGKP